MSWKDDVEAMQAFVDRHGLDGFPHLEDDGTVFAQVGLTSQPGWAFVAEDGRAEVVPGSLDQDDLAERIEGLTAP